LFDAAYLARLGDVVEDPFRAGAPDKGGGGGASSGGGDSAAARGVTDGGVSSGGASLDAPASPGAAAGPGGQGVNPFLTQGIGQPAAPTPVLPAPGSPAVLPVPAARRPGG